MAQWASIGHALIVDIDKASATPDGAALIYGRGVCKAGTRPSVEEALNFVRGVLITFEELIPAELGARPSLLVKGMLFGGCTTRTTLEVNHRIPCISSVLLVIVS